MTQTNVVKFLPRVQPDRPWTSVETFDFGQVLTLRSPDGFVLSREWRYNTGRRVNVAYDHRGEILFYKETLDRYTQPVNTFRD